MKTTAQIILTPVSALQPQPVPGALPASAPHPMTAEIGRVAGNALVRRLQQMFAHAGDRLLQMSECATTEAERHAHFDAMRLLAFEQTRLLRSFPHELARSLATFAPPERTRLPDLRLALLPEQELEDSILLARISSRVKTRCKHALTVFEQRLEVLERDMALPPLARALTPRRFCEIYAVCLDKLEVGYRVRHILLELFEHSVLADCTAFYHELNTVLDRYASPVVAAPGAADLQRADVLARVHRMVSYELAVLINGRVLHPGARRFFCSAMAPLLSMRLLRYGAQSKLWQDALHRAAQLLRSLEPDRLQDDDGQRDEYLEATASDLREIGFQQAQLDTLFADLRQAYVGRLTQSTAAAGATNLH